MAELKKKFDGQLTTKFMESLSDRLALKIKEESEIEGAIAELENSPIKITDLQAEGDRRATAEQAKQKDLKEKIKELESKKEPPKEPEKVSDNNSLKALEEKIEEMEKDRKRREAKSKLEAKAKEKKIPQVLIENANVESEEEIEEALVNLEAKSKELKQQFLDDGLVTEPPKKPSGGAGDDTQIKEDIKAFKIKK